jgi:sugar phosphate isomerase/epimerase
MCCGIDRLQEVADAGYAYVEPSVSGTLIPEQDEAAFAPIRKKIEASPIRTEAFNMFVPAHLRVTGPEVDRKRLAAYMEVAVRRASEVGASIIVFGSGGARRAPDGFPKDKALEQFADAAKLAAEAASKCKITIILEPLNSKQCNILNRVDQGAAMVDRVNHPNFKLLADLFHVHADNEPVQNIVAAGKRMGHAHLATPSIPETGPGIEYDFKSFLKALKTAGYDGRISVEDNPGLLGKKTPPLTEVYRAIKAFIERQ